MIIEIKKPELETLLCELQKSGLNLEDVLFESLSARRSKPENTVKYQRPASGKEKSRGSVCTASRYGFRFQPQSIYWPPIGSMNGLVLAANFTSIIRADVQTLWWQWHFDKGIAPLRCRIDCTHNFRKMVLHDRPVSIAENDKRNFPVR